MSIVIHCPTCKSPMALPPGTKRGEFICPNCGAHLRVGGGAAPPKETPTSEVSWESLPKPVKASLNSTRQGSEFWHEASQAAADAIRKQSEQPIRETERRTSYRPNRSSTSPWVGCFAIFGVISVIGVIGIVVLIAIGMAMIDQPMEIAVDHFRSTARGSKRVSAEQHGDTQVAGVESRTTGSGFIMTRKTIPGGGRPDLDGYLVNLGMTGNVTSSKRIQRLGFDGIRYEYEGRSIKNPSHTGEVFDTNGSVLVLMYLPGSKAKKLLSKRSWFNSEQERERDRPDEFFDSFSQVP